MTSELNISFIPKEEVTVLKANDIILVNNNRPQLFYETAFDESIKDNARIYDMFGRNGDSRAGGE